MGKNTRYDTFRDRIRRRFSRNKTLQPAIASGDSELLFDLANYKATGNDYFLESGPFNYVHIRNTGGADIRAYLSNDLQTFVDVQAPSGASAEREATEAIPIRYVGYLRIENLADATEIAEGDVTIQVGTKVDSVELDLLKMAGMLNIGDESEN